MDQKIISLQEKISSVPQKIECNTDGLIKIILNAIESLEKFTRSPLTNKLINEPVMTPSLAIVDKSDVAQIRDTRNPQFITKAVPSGEIIYKPFKKFVTLRGTIKHMYETELKKINEQKAKSAKAPTVSATEKGLRNQLEQRLREINNLNTKIEELESENAKISSQLDKKLQDDKVNISPAVIADLNNQVKLLKNANESWKKKVSELNGK